MNFYLVAPVVRAYQQSEPLTYSSASTLSQGQVVLVEFGNKKIIGIIRGQAGQPDFKTKSIIKVIEEKLLPSPLVKLVDWISKYYLTAPSAVWQTALPRGLDKKRRQHSFSVPHVKRNRTNIVLNKDQLEAINKISNMTPGTALLQGVTGSGKTQVYIEMTKKILHEKSQSVIILVPEIALTSQIMAEFNNHFEGDIIVTHSTMTESQRHAAWLDCLHAKKPKVIIGPRSALFSPVSNLGLIVIDECHEPSFKQEQAPRYSALRAASVLAHEHQAKLILGSATPSIADYYLAKKNSRPIITLTKPAQPDYKPAEIKLIDMTKRQNFTRHRFLSNQLLSSIESSLQKNEQVLIFHNRRGSAPSTMCENCGWHATCKRCFVPLILHDDTFSLHCHICGLKESVPTTCPECEKATIIHKGIGTKLITDELRKQFPRAITKRFDGDSHSDETVDKMYQELYDGKIQIIIGTQVVAKGLDLPKLSTIGVVQADSGLFLPDFSASERVFQLTAQALGRVGRHNTDSQAIIQSYQPDHPSITSAISEDGYEEFYRNVLTEREKGKFPPFSYLLKLTCAYKTESGAINAARKLANTLHSQADKNSVVIFGPTPSFYERMRNTYRWQLIIKSTNRKALVNLLKDVPNNKWQAELDPVSLL